jgi:hypothetical protein
MIEFHKIDQNSDEWLQLRVGKITGSSLACIMANYGRAFGAPAKKYASVLALGQITGKVIASGYTNADMERGHAEEGIARCLYEDRYFSKVSEGGFFSDGDLGCSPDGLVGSDGLIEIKSALPHIHYDRIRKQSYDSAYKWQLAGNLMFTGRDWIDFVSYCADYPEGKQLYVYRCTKESFAEEFKMINERLITFRELVIQAKAVILHFNYSLTEIKS